MERQTTDRATDGQQPGQGAQQQEAQQGAEPEAKGGPDPAKAAEKYKAQRDDYAAKIAEYEERLKGYEGQDETIRALQADLEKTRKESEAKLKRSEFERVNGTRLAQAGCVDVEVALGLLDENGDVDALRESKPYLFAKPQGSTGFKPAGQEQLSAAEEARLRRVAGLPDKK